MVGIYKITNQINGKVYIGQSRNITQRWKAHRTRYQKEDYPIYKAMRKYGIDNFFFEVIEECQIEQLNEREIYWIKFFSSDNREKGYNITAGGEHGYPLKITKEDVFEIYKRLETSETMESIGKSYGVTHETISEINNGHIWVQENINYPIRQTRNKKYYCCDCGIEISKWGTRCPQCAKKYRYDIYYIEQGYPSREELKIMIKNLPFTEIGRKYDVRDNTIRKWCKHYNLPSKKKDINTYSDEEWEQI